NKALEKVTGISRSTVIGTNKQWMAFYSMERPVMADLIVDEVSENGIFKYYSGKYRKSAGIENAYEAEDFFPDMGKAGKWLYFTAAPLRNSAGATIGAVETLQDTTSRKKAEQALTESEEKYRLLVEFANDAIFIAQDDSIKFPNPKTLDLVGYPAEELEKMPFPNLIHPDDRNLVLERYKQILMGEELLRPHSFRVLHKTGKRLNVQIS
ncbi:MAG: PAS domain S-box protein, partial [Bacteroidetes bacterium]|nr:PAS domain S-box protein [Bacteroidota bacterium]